MSKIRKILLILLLISAGTALASVLSKFYIHLFITSFVIIMLSLHFAHNILSAAQSTSVADQNFNKDQIAEATEKIHLSIAGIAALIITLAMRFHLFF